MDKKTKLNTLVKKYGTHSISETMRYIAAYTQLSPYLAREVQNMAKELQDALVEHEEIKNIQSAPTQRVPARYF